MFIQRILPEKGWGKIDRNVMTNKKLTNGAKVLYAVLVGFPPGANYTDAYLAKILDSSQRAIYRRKGELKKEGLLLIERLAPTVYQAYLGHSKLTAHQVRDILDKQVGYNVSKEG